MLADTQIVIHPHAYKHGLEEKQIRRIRDRNEASAMNDHIAADGTVLTDAVIAELAQEAEQGFPNSELTAEASPWARPAPMETHSVRVPGDLWSLVAERAKKQNMSMSEYTRLALLRSLQPR